MEFFDLKVIARSSRSMLYRALRKDGKAVALKMAGDSEMDRVMLRREFELSRTLSHPGLPYVLSYETDPERGEFIVMEYVDGITLDGYLKTNPSLEERRRVFVQILDVVSYIHKRGVIHNDLKPQNIMVSYVSNSVKLIDFGMSADDSGFLAEMAKGTPGYASPELFAGGNVDVRSDIWSLGILVKDMFGRKCSRISARCQEYDPQKRYASVDELKAAFIAHNFRPVSAVVTVALLLAVSAYAFWNFGRPGRDVAVPPRVAVTDTVVQCAPVDSTPSANDSVSEAPTERRDEPVASVPEAPTARFATLPRVETLAADVSVLKVPVLKGKIKFHESVMLPDQVIFRYGPVVDGSTGFSYEIPATIGDDGVFTATVNEHVYCDIDYQFAACAVFGNREVAGKSTRFRYDTPAGTVDLGLDVLWAECNLGADTPDDVGDFYCWGETEPHYSRMRSNVDFDWKPGREGWFPNTYLFYVPPPGDDGDDNAIAFSKYNEADGKTDLDPEDDAARVQLGGRWKIPSHSEWEELRRKTAISEWVDGMGLVGFKAESIVPELKGRVIYFQSAPYARALCVYKSDKNQGYMSSTLKINRSRGYSGMYKETGENKPLWGHRFVGRPIRPVWDWKTR